jgi:HD-GYP domain-containing protein (c-di-GMP phosphodiesterase class II)
MNANALLAELDPTWVDHGLRVQRMAASIGRELTLSVAALDRIQIAALLHDIGKARLDPAVLALPRRLTPGEWEHVQEHPMLGFEMVAGNVHDEVAQAVLGHHERWDGSGYPNRLMGTDTPLIARILAVADAYDAIVSDRVYDPARSVSTAIAEITNGAGTQFDPAVVNAFCTVMTRAMAAPFGGHRRIAAVA